MSARKRIVNKYERREINEFLPYLLSYSVDSLKHQQRNIEVEIEDLKKNFASELSMNIHHVISNIETFNKMSKSIPVMVDSNRLQTELIKDLEK